MRACRNARAKLNEQRAEWDTHEAASAHMVQRGTPTYFAFAHRLARVCSACPRGSAPDTPDQASIDFERVGVRPEQ